MIATVTPCKPRRRDAWAILRGRYPTYSEPRVRVVQVRRATENVIGDITETFIDGAVSVSSERVAMQVFRPSSISDERAYIYTRSPRRKSALAVLCGLYRPELVICQPGIEMHSRVVKISQWESAEPSIALIDALPPSDEMAQLLMEAREGMLENHRERTQL